ncbi:hypothetical protein ACTOB_002207 [Actinoplanes oblitus]|uniref:Uncharacterized protein n=1 Tax=Actinoplanes oblitus TaxID=3040509 RepID=A0ABY8WLT2_9ACTN|nr:hypothetical protein [Actinoplanes oblitus]WIM98603.1 hypothetical protein ACTOB_002207 [Actinoplanes oblitus]
MTSPTVPPSRRWWWIAAAAVVLVAAGVLFAVTNSAGEEPSADGPTPAASSSARPAHSAPACLPTVSETGFSVVRQTVQYAVMTRNDCPDAVINAAVKVRVLDPSGDPVAGRDEQLPDVVVLLPGQELAGAGSFFLDKAGSKVSEVEATFVAATPAPAEAFNGWPREVRVTDVTVGAADSHGRSVVTGRIVTDPPGATLCSPAASLILRDRSGALIYGMTGQIRDDQVTFELAVPENTDRGKITVAIAQGRPALTLHPVATAACTA